MNEQYLKDVELLIPLFDEYRMFYGQASDWSGARTFLTERLSLDESVVFIAVEGEGESKRYKGFIQLYPSYSSVSMQSLWILNDLYVNADHRGIGIGSMLLEYFCDFIPLQKDLLLISAKPI